MSGSSPIPSFDHAAVAAAPLDYLDYFVEWGGRSWSNLTRAAICDCIGKEHLQGARVLEIGARYGKMSVLFALMGAEVTGLEVHEFAHHLETAKEEADDFGVADRVSFAAYDGDLDTIDMGLFDVVFTKSVLVVIPDLAEFLNKVNRKLERGGHGVFLENGRGGLVAQTLRRVRHRRWNWRTAQYFGEENLQPFHDCFDRCEIRRSFFPPVYLIHGQKNA